MSFSINDAFSFFQLSCGSWKSQRSTHHLLHRQAEPGTSFILVKALELTDDRLRKVAEMHEYETSKLIGGCSVQWSGSMAWDQEGESHKGESVFGLVPSNINGREGFLLRDRGYAETAPVAGKFRMDEYDTLILETGYDTMNTIERFWFSGPDLRLRSSVVEGLSNTASFCVETRYK
ncbi:Phycoerythrin linker protein CpeS homolog (chromatophore) [Paulinella micropora]|uniref:Chromophore lyase CpcS/CpeS n=1 Tax=Paulinella micropora TaxID=1928728 RepID=A0A1L5YCH3_9EUKA|nr:hypothetical protein PCKR_645 [Paulinella micropora]AQX45180.1 hypothetical protein PFK_645 [Paulinella micropora]BBL86397.1 Phycoerythrin linker protein CpeS homolog [Paulinella micropora]